MKKKIRKFIINVEKNQFKNYITFIYKNILKKKQNENLILKKTTILVESLLSKEVNFNRSLKKKNKKPIINDFLI